MCFMEYLGYTCGHTSPAVLRTCPQTTGIPTNPVCKNPATRPQLMASFCVACAHVQHKRWSDIMEQEHRWLHERGACGCPVKFPDLMQPRMVVGGGRRGSHGVLSADGTVCTIVGGADVTAPSGGSAGGGGGSGEGGGGGDNSQHHHHRGGGFGKKGNKRGGKNWRRGGGGGGGGGGYSQNSHDQPNRAQQQKDKYPALQEIREGDDVRYAVRLPSMYGVEWAWDHEKLHREGKCPCAVRFDKHVPQHNLPNTQHSLVQPAEYTATGSGNQAYNATFSGNDFLATRPFEQSSSEQPSAQSATTQSSAAYPSDVQSSMQNWVQPIMQPSEQHQQQHYGQQTSATQNPHTQTERPQISSAQIFDMQGYQYSMQDMAQSSGEHNSQRHSNNNNNNNSTQAFGQPFEPRNNTQTTGGTDPFSQTMPDSIMDLFAQQPEDGNAAPPPSVSSYTMPTVPIDGDGMAAWNLSQPQRWTCNPPEGYYNAQEVYLPPAFPSTNTNTDTSETDTIRPLTAHGASAAASNNYNNNYSNTGSSSNANRNNKGKSKANDNSNNNAPSGSGSGGGGGFGYGDPPRPVDMQTMWFSSTPQEGEHNAQPPVVGLPIGRGPEGADGALQAPGQTYHHEQQQPEDGMIPFNGFPIGAGPEGDPHAGSFDECEFYRTNTTTSNKSSSTSGARRDRHGRGLRRPSSSSF